MRTSGNEPTPLPAEPSPADDRVTDALRALLEQLATTGAQLERLVATIADDRRVRPAGPQATGGPEAVGAWSEPGVRPLLGVRRVATAGRPAADDDGPSEDAAEADRYGAAVLPDGLAQHVRTVETLLAS